MIVTTLFCLRFRNQITPWSSHWLDTWRPCRRWSLAPTESGSLVLVRLLFIFPPSDSSNLTFESVHFQPLISSSRFGAPTTVNSRRRLRVTSWASAMWHGAATVAYSSPPATTRRWKSGSWAAAKAWRPSKVTAITFSVATSIRKAISSCRVVLTSRCESGMLERESV